MDLNRKENEIKIFIEGYSAYTEDKLLNFFKKARNDIEKFAKKYDWESYTKEPFIEQVSIFNKQKDLIKRVAKISGMEKKKFPKKFSAVIINKDMYILTPGEYKKVYPAGKDKNSYKKLIIHELAHQLHARILNNKEEMMGPKWFYEGFAIFAAGQFKDYNLTPEEVWEVIEKESKKEYKYYGAVFRFLLKKTTLNQLINRARDKKFLEWLKSL